MEPIEAFVRFKVDGEVVPLRLVIRGVEMPVEETGRHWNDADGLHILVMLPGARTGEVLLPASEPRWYFRWLPGERNVVA